MNQTKEQLLAEIAMLRRELNRDQTAEFDSQPLMDRFGLLAKAVETMPLGVTITDLERKIIYVNPADAQMHGYAAAELFGQDASIFAPPAFRKPVSLEHIKAWKGLIRESINLRKDGSLFPVWLMSEIVRTATGEPYAIVTSCEDITERKHAREELQKYRAQLEELVQERTQALSAANTQLQQEISERQRVEDALRKSEEQYRTLFENLQEVFYRTDPQGQLVLVSPSMVQLLGYTQEEAIRLNLGRDLFIHPEQWQVMLTRLEQDGAVMEFEVLLKRCDGSMVWGSSTSQWYTDQTGRVLGIEGMIRDITERKQAEAQLRASAAQLRELNASKDTFFSIIAHDLRGPLSSLYDLTQLITEYLDSYSSNELKEMLILQKTSVENLYKLLENLLTWSRFQRGVMTYQPQPLDLKWLVTRNLELLAFQAERKQITFTSSIAERMLVEADFNMLDTVVRNLFSNALKFTYPGGAVVVSAQRQESVIEVSVADTGIGIGAKHFPDLFRIDVRYKRPGTNQEEGTGLGLVLCKEFVERHGGRILVASEVGKGTTFRFTLPSAANEALEAGDVG